MIKFYAGVVLILTALAFQTSQEVVSQPQPKPQIEIKTQEPEVKKKTQMLYFGATWCPPCKKMKQLFKDPEVKKELDRLDFRMYDSSKDKPLFKKFNINLYPTTIFQAEGAITVRYTGYIPKKDLLEILRNIKD